MDRDCLPAFIGDISMTIVDAMAKIDSNSRGIVFIVDERDSLCGCITDGDIRRWILKAGDIHETVCCAMTHSPKYLFCEERAKAYGVMVKNFITALPILDHNRHIIDIILFREGSNYSVPKKEGSLRCSCGHHGRRKRDTFISLYEGFAETINSNWRYTNCGENNKLFYGVQYFAILYDSKL